MIGGLHIPRWQSPAQVEALFARQRTGDRVGYAIQLWLTLAACGMLFGPTFVVELAWVPALICFLVRMTGQHAVLEPLAFDRVFWSTLAFWALGAASILWTFGSRAEWLGDVQGVRFVPILFIIWCVLDRRSWIIAAVLAGGVLGLVAQLAHLIDVKSGGVLGLPIERMPGRISGWWDPVSGGSILVALLGLWMAPVLWSRTWRVRAAGMIGACATMAGVLLTGTRGAWIAAAMLVPIAAVIALWRVRPMRRVLAPVSVIAIAGVVGVAGAWTLGGEPLRQRVRGATTDLRLVFDSRNYDSDTGMRLAMWKWASAAWRSHPSAGVGAGGYQPWVRSRTTEQATALNAPGETAPRVHAHAHSWSLHVLATLGSIGGLVLLAMVGLGAWSGLTARGNEHMGALAAGPAIAIIGLGLAGLFDAITVNQQTTVVLFVLLALCLDRRPAEALPRRGGGAA
ncbi:MAG: O-antigen ligase family protein [Phycisphaerales bacterium]|nr:O-antigen ligase family protein [Phycisphaerales bacterium]